jgi:hypothetical protein
MDIRLIRLNIPGIACTNDISDTSTRSGVPGDPNANNSEEEDCRSRPNVHDLHRQGLCAGAAEDAMQCSQPRDKLMRAKNDWDRYCA